MTDATSEVGDLGPPASGVRVPYDAVPPQLHAWVDTQLGSAVVGSATQTGGFSPGVAARLRCADGSRAFVKAVSADANPESPQLHRREIEVLQLLPRDLPVPRLIAAYDEHPWVALLVDDVEGSQPQLPWRGEELDRMLDLTRAVSGQPGAVLRPAREKVAQWRGWASFADEPDPAVDEWARRHLGALVALEAEADDAVDGDRLVHLDIRADNVLLGPSSQWLVDWPWAARGPRWLDPVISGPAVAMQSGPSAEDYLQRSGLAGRDDAEAVTAVVAAFAGVLAWLASRPPPPGLPTVRAFQDAQAAIALHWLQQRTGWR